MSLTARIAASLLGSFQKTKGLGQGRFDLDLSASRELASGVGAGQVDLAYVSRGVSIGPSANLDIDLNGSTLDALGDALPLVRVKAFFLYSYAANLNTLRIGNHPTAGFIGWFGAAAHTEDVFPDGLVLRTHPGAGWLVTPATADILRVANIAGVNTDLCDIGILGCSA